MTTKAFVPLESNPEVFNAFLEKLGVPGVEFIDVYSLDPEMLPFVPRPVRAILLVFPISETYEDYRRQNDSTPAPGAQPTPPPTKTDAVWAKQTIVNACGTMALLHALANGVPTEQLGSGAGKSIVQGLTSTPVEDRPQFLENNAELEQMHASVAQSGDTAAPGAEDSVENHYVCITKNGDQLLELDGRRIGPIVRAEGISEPDILEIPQTIKTIQEFLTREQGNPNFAMLALVDRN